MTNIEIGILIALVLVPILALLFILPKKKKKAEEKAEVKTTEYVSEKKEEKPKEDLKPISVKSLPLNANDFSDNDFKDYLKSKQKSISKPKRFDARDDDFLESYSSFKSRRAKIKENKTIAEQINELSPELKVLMVAGVLNKKDFE